MKYFSYKRLNKRRKFYFWLFLTGGLCEILLGIMAKDIPMCTLGVIILTECIVLHTDQINDDIIDNYANMLEIMHKVFEASLVNVKELIREGNNELLNKYADTIDSFYKEENNDSNEGK